MPTPIPAGPAGSFCIRHRHDPEPLKRFAELVRQLRAAQKAGGSGYKTPAATTSATILEKRVDDALTLILGA